MRLRSLLILAIPIVLLSACQKTNHQEPVHYKTKVVKKVVHVPRKAHPHKPLKPVPPVANLKPKHGTQHYRILNDPVVVLTFRNTSGKNTGTQMTDYLNSIVNLNQYHVQVSTSNKTTYVTLKQINNY